MCLLIIKNNCHFDGSRSRPGKVVRVATCLVPVDGTGHPGFAAGKSLEEIKLSTTIGVTPARARSVLLSSRDESVKHPDSRHVVAGSVEWHRKLEKKNLRSATESVVCWYTGTIITTTATTRTSSPGK